MKHILRVIITICVVTAQLQLNAIIVHAEAFVSDPAICIIGDEQVPFFFPDGTSIEEEAKKCTKRLLRDLSKGSRKIDIILEGNSFGAKTLRQQKEDQKRTSPSIKTGLFSSIVLSAQKRNLKLGDNIRFRYTNNFGPATSSIASFCTAIQLIGKTVLSGYINRRCHEKSLSGIAEALELSTKVPDAISQPSDYDAILSNSTLKPLFFNKGEEFDRHMQSFRKMHHNPTVKQLFDELSAAQESMKQLTKQLHAAKFPRMEIIKGAEENIDALIKQLRVDFVEKYAGRNLNKINSLPFIDVIIKALKEDKFEEIVGFLRDWFSYFSLHACTMLAFKTVLQSINEHRSVLLIGSPKLSMIIHTLLRYSTEHKEGAVKEEIRTPPMTDEFGQDQIKKLLHSMRNILLDLRCQTCGNSLDLMRCRGCKKVRYCSVDCQKKDWPQHKLTCTGAIV